MTVAQTYRPTINKSITYSLTNRPKRKDKGKSRVIIYIDIVNQLKTILNKDVETIGSWNSCPRFLRL